MKVWACQHFFQQENWSNGDFVIFSNHHMARCFLHYLVILLICLSDQNVRFRIRILRKFTVTQFFLKDRSEGKVPNSALDIVSTGGILPFTVGILIFMHNIWYMDFMSYWICTCWECWKGRLNPVAEMLCWCVRDMIMSYRP